MQARVQDDVRVIVESKAATEPGPIYERSDRQNGGEAQDGAIVGA